MPDGQRAGMQRDPAGERPRGAVGGIALHARALNVEHPVRHEPLTIEAPLPDSWRMLGLRPG